MDLPEALRIVNTRFYLPGKSDAALLERIMKSPDFSARGKTPSPAVGLERGIMLRPVEALHELSYVTRPRYQEDLYDYYMQWALLRYLGFFDHVTGRRRSPALGLSQAGQRTIGNQRRVASEELGIGFGALLAKRWFATATGNPPVRIVDVDVALDDRVVVAAGSRLPIRKRGQRRPDYILIADDPAAPSRYRIRVLECKGAGSYGVAIRQMAKALDQLEGLIIDGHAPPGLAVGTIAADKNISYVAVDPGDEEETSYEINSNSIARAAEFRLSNYDTHIPGPELASASLRASWGMLADFGGNLNALDQWAPASMRRKLDRNERQRSSFETPFGTARGTSITFSFDRWRLNVRYAIVQAVDQALTQRDPESIADAQATFARRLEERTAMDEVQVTIEPGAQVLELEEGSADATFALEEPDSEPHDVFSARPDGSIFSLSIE